MWKPLPDRPSAGLIPRLTSCGILAGLGPVEKGDAVMVGDRRFDIIGAHELGLPVIYVTYGYGDEAERKAFETAMMRLHYIIRDEGAAATVGDLAANSFFSIFGQT